MPRSHPTTNGRTAVSCKAVLSSETIRRLAVLRAVSTWRDGAWGPVRIHKTLFFSDNACPERWRMFSHKRWYLGQYSDEISEALNVLRRARRIESDFRGPSEVIRASIDHRTKRRIAAFFNEYFPEWVKAFRSAFRKWGYMTGDDIITKAHDDPTYTKSQHGDLILSTGLPPMVEFEGLSPEEAESLSDLVDDKLRQVLSRRLNKAVERLPHGEDWRKLYFS